MKKILITGVTGFAGFKIYHALKNSGNYEVKGTGRSSGESVDFVADLTDLESVKNMGQHFSPDVVIHLAAMAKTDICERNKDDCYAANVISTKNLVEMFPDCKFIYFSTYAVYNTKKGNCDESCKITATNHYIQTKIEAESYVNPLNDYIIFRPSVIFGYMPLKIKTKNYFMQLIEMVHDKKVMRSPADQFFNPVSIDVVAEIIGLSIEGDVSGVFNIGSNEDISKYDFNLMIMERFGFNLKYLEPAVADSFAVKRPGNGTVSSMKIQFTLSYRVPGISEMIDSLYDEIKENPDIPGV
ncbi:SDR family oxidoreductase [Methanoplanus endosymbiosus]|uniref:Sugar nucleotide-binding protein n=1 Tax=Methanoplanus endosymbiosus TaxID=33865 RepID=A0A9E7PLQ4_9EURY|nr:sugar nucleotide-binding protein [Methanoplanus endosymbiosus]UUX91667.1 sugar nucleotide-binding protein [Methanoplanus endosymbiosus]